MSHPKSIATISQPREKLLRYGASQLSLPELWMCVLGHGTKYQPVNQVAHQLTKLLRESDCSTKNPALLQALSKLLSQVQLVRVLAVLDLWDRWTQHQQRVFCRPKDALLLFPELVSSHHERVVCLYLSASCEILRQETLAIGSWNAALLQPRDVFFPIRWLPVDSLVLCHNHPSGKLLPSETDKRFTQRIQAAAGILGITLHDHIIVGKTGYFSFKEAGLLV